MTDLVTWLRARLDEDERVARASTKPGVYWYMDGHSDEAFAHLTRWDPARVLAEVDAKRRIIDEAIRLDSYDSEFEFLELLALPYADRPGYREEWKP